jgi:hypothetical protein
MNISLCDICLYVISLIKIIMVLAHRALRDKLFQDTVMSNTDAVTIFDAGAGQVSLEEHDLI